MTLQQPSPQIGLPQSLILYEYEGAIASTSKTLIIAVPSTSDNKFIGPAEIAPFPCVTEARPTNRSRAPGGGSATVLISSPYKETLIAAQQKKTYKRPLKPSNLGEKKATDLSKKVSPLHAKLVRTRVIVRVVEVIERQTQIVILKTI